MKNINKEKCKEWAKAMLILLEKTEALTFEEAEYIKLQLNLAFIKNKIEDFEKGR